MTVWRRDGWRNDEGPMHGNDALVEYEERSDNRIAAQHQTECVGQM